MRNNLSVHMDEQSRGQSMAKQAEAQRIQKLFEDLNKQPKHPFPKSGNPEATDKHGVYVLRNAKELVVHVGRTYRGMRGINQRLGNHLAATSSFTKIYLKHKGSDLREGYTYQYLAVPDDRERALLEYLATARNYPIHLGVHTAKAKIVKRPA